MHKKKLSNIFTILRMCRSTLQFIMQHHLGRFPPNLHQKGSPAPLGEMEETDFYSSPAANIEAGQVQPLLESPDDIPGVVQFRPWMLVFSMPTDQQDYPAENGVATIYRER